MSGNEINRRDFLKFVGLGGVGAATLSGCDMPTTVTLEEGKEKVVSYLTPEEYAIPGIGVWYASTCQECPSSCGIHGRVREGRVLKVEGNPHSEMNGGGLCQMAHAGLQSHYNPDRLSKPMVRKNGSLTEVSWTEAWALVEEKVGAATGSKIGWLTGAISGHQAQLLAQLQADYGSEKHYVYEAINNSVGENVNAAVTGDATPRYRFDKAQSVLSFGADFLGTWVSPVHFSKEYAEFRSGNRGVLMVVEPKMTMTGANADLWVPARPGTEGVLALGVANVLISKYRANAGALSPSVRDVIGQYGPSKVTEVTGVDADTVAKIAAFLKNNSPSIVLSGASAQEHARGSQNAAAAMMLNVLLGNIGNTIESSGKMAALADLAGKPGSSRAVLDFAKDATAGALDVLFIKGANPVFTAPPQVAVADSLAKVPFKVALSMFIDETSALADVVLPLASPYEDWGTTVAAYQPGEKLVAITQPLMQPLYPETKGFGDILLALSKAKTDKHKGVDDYYAYVRQSLAAMPASVKQGKGDTAFWNESVQQGFVRVAAEPGSLSANSLDVKPASYKTNADYPMHLVPSARQGLWDGRFANIPWIQESPDQISKIFWDSWAELHPSTAAKLGVEEGDVISIESAQGKISAQVYIFRGVHPDVVAVPMGQGHDNYGRYATGVGVNPRSILDNITDKDTGEIAAHATRVRIAKTGESAEISRLGGSETQAGRKLVSTVTAETFRKTEGGGHVA